MPGRQPLPHLWLMTDERLGDSLWDAIERLPRGSGIVFRHYATPLAERRALWARMRRVAARRRLMLVRAGDAGLPGEDGTHNTGRGGGVRTGSAHHRREAVARVRQGCRVLFVSPVFATRSHPGTRPLGCVRAGAVVSRLPVTRIAMGGMSAARFRRVKPLGFDGWAAIDAWRPDQKRKAVPR